MPEALSFCQILPDKGKGGEGAGRGSAGAISECIWALAVLGGGAVYESETDMLIQKLTKNFKANDIAGLSNFGPGQLATFGWALSVLQQQDTPLFWLVWAEICRRPRASFSKKAVHMQLHQVALEANTAGVDIALYDKQGLLEAAKLEWDNEIVNKRSKQGSYYARDILTTVIGLGLHHIEEDASAGYAVDSATGDQGAILKLPLIRGGGAQCEVLRSAL
ncbi:hypothetical protein WJX79_000462 [Trebouxia sp. C0005]